MAVEAITGKPPSRDDPILEEVTRRLVEACQPDRIYLFGSAARNEADADSDWDILLVVPDDAPRDVLSGRRGYDAIRELGLYADVVVEPRTYFLARLGVVASMPATVVREGKLLYQAANGHAQMPVDPADKAEETAQWLAKARNDLRMIEAALALAPPDIGNALYHSQQAAEKAFKALLMWHDVPFHKTHKLDELGGPCVECDSSLADLTQRAAKLSEYVFKFRYPGLPDPPLSEAREALVLAREVYDAVLARVPPEARP